MLDFTASNDTIPNWDFPILLQHKDNPLTILIAFSLSRTTIINSFMPDRIGGIRDISATYELYRPYKGSISNSNLNELYVKL